MKPARGRFRRGEFVEIIMKDEGFNGSYYIAIVLSGTGLPDNNYLVEYQTLESEIDESLLLREILSADVVRPLPPTILATRFGIGDKVDVYYNDGWWTGRVRGKSEGSSGRKYSVYFRNTGEVFQYSVHELRVHQDWKDGKWVASKRRP
ncbi:hypothetical protein GIB67_023863 [Kingdonia uniflora]|uniref:Agenet domain-containing protein n=1 Tax=Kingdonia uniflora TaxID=39325 RepID=A0A7J7NGG4_9MAGN|nr:hypothetical protein GIB67_023863 [Kingdonia uniflora]